MQFNQEAMDLNRLDKSSSEGEEEERRHKKIEKRQSGESQEVDYEESLKRAQQELISSRNSSKIANKSGEAGNNLSKGENEG